MESLAEPAGKHRIFGEVFQYLQVLTSDSGKSSLILTLLLFLEYDGTILIDGTDISSISCQELRSRITTVPQDAIELGGTVRENLDPFVSPVTTDSMRNVPIDDSTMQEALTRVGIWQQISACGGLDAHLSAVSLSQGQKQLLCLARAVLHHAKTRSQIVLMDEATSSVDSNTEAQMQAIISDEFAGCTVIAIAHRLETLKDVDVVLELDAGRLVGYTKRK